MKSLNKSAPKKGREKGKRGVLFQSKKQEEVWKILQAQGKL